jgi:hypothetical protein
MQLDCPSSSIPVVEFVAELMRWLLTFTEVGDDDDGGGKLPGRAAAGPAA